MSFEENIKQWVLLDNQLKILNEKAKEIREKEILSMKLFRILFKKTTLLINLCKLATEI